MKYVEYIEQDGVEVEVWSDHSEPADAMARNTGFLVELIGIALIAYAFIMYIFPLIIAWGV